MSGNIQLIAKVKQKGGGKFKLLDLSDVNVDDLVDDNNDVDVNKVLSIKINTDTQNTKQFTSSGISWLPYDGKDNKGACKIDGDLYLYGGLFQYSDISLKKNIIPITNSIQILNKIEGVQFNWKSDNSRDYGFIAQDVQKIIPQMTITQFDTGLKRVNYIKIVPFLLQAIRQLNQEIKEMKKQIKFLKDNGDNM